MKLEEKSNCSEVAKCSLEFMNAFLYTELSSPEEETAPLCLGQKALINWILRIHPSNKQSHHRVSKRRMDLVFVFVLQSPTFLQRFAIWYLQNKETMLESANEGDREHMANFSNYLENLISFHIDNVSIIFSC